MKKLSKIKLTNLSQEDLADREMNALRGGNNAVVVVIMEDLVASTM